VDLHHLATEFLVAIPIVCHPSLYVLLRERIAHLLASHRVGPTPFGAGRVFTVNSG
jgi:hypothetical protein